MSARSEHDADTRRAAAWLHGKLAGIGFATETIPTAGHPVVLAEWRKAPAGAPTVLVYGHYDVQPPEPLDLWTSPAFEPAVRDGKLFARGAVDDKGQLWIHVKALEAQLAVRGTLPVNVIVLAEGEEEIGSEHLAEFVERHAQRLACDAVVISDSSMFAPGIPSILSSLRGLAYFEITVQGPGVRPALRHVRRRRRESRDGARAHPLDLPRRARPHRHQGILRQGAAVSRGRPQGHAPPAVQRRAVQEGSRREVARRRGGEDDTREALDAADPRGERHALRLHRRGREDRAPRDGDGEGELPPRARPAIPT